MTLDLSSLLSRTALHVVVDMQRLFAEPTAWCVPAIREILPGVGRLVRHAPERAVFTRFLPPARPLDATGAWRGYYERWESVTLAKMEPALIDLVPPLGAFVPPAAVCDKRSYSAFKSRDFRERIREVGADVLVLSGVETDVCVLGTALEAIDEGLFAIIVADAVASSSPAAHRAVLESVLPRFDEQASIATVEEVIAAWPRSAGTCDGRR